MAVRLISLAKLLAVVAPGAAGLLALAAAVRGL